MEDEQRKIELVNAQMTRLKRYAFGVQQMFFGSVAMCALGPLATYRGYTLADVLRSPVRRWTSNEIACRLSNPMCAIGLASSIYGWTMVWKDYANWQEAERMVTEAQNVLNDSDAFQQALRVGAVVMKGGSAASAGAGSSSK